MYPSGCFLKWWYPQNTLKWSLLVGKPMGLLGKPTSLGNPHVVMVINITNSWPFFQTPNIFSDGFWAGWRDVQHGPESDGSDTNVFKEWETCAQGLAWNRYFNYGFEVWGQHKCKGEQLRRMVCSSKKSACAINCAIITNSWPFFQTPNSLHPKTFKSLPLIFSYHAKRRL